MPFHRTQPPAVCLVIRSVALIAVCCVLSACDRRGNGSAGSAEWQAERKPAPIIGAYYYPWYWPSRWTEQPVANTPKLGHYSSDDPKAAKQHIAWAREADIDFFIMSWLSPEGPEDRNLKQTLVPALEKEHYRFIILYETRLALGWPYDKPIDMDQTLPNATKAGYTMAEHFEYLAETYFRSPSYFRVDGKPVVILYAMGYTANAEPYFKYLRQRLAKRGLDPYLIADIVYWDPLEKNDWGLLKKHFQAITTYNLWTRPNFLNAVRAQFRVADRMARESGLRLIPNVMPGYDDTRLRGLTREIFDRRGGQFYRDYWSLASDFVDARQPFLFITSFNEWHEGSELEPSAEYGDTYLELTRKQTAELRKTLGLPKP